MNKKSSLAMFALLAIALLFSGCRVVLGDGPKVVKDFQPGDFDSIDVSHAFTVHVSQGTECKVTVRVPQNLMKYLVVEVNHRTLNIGFQQGNSYQNCDGEVDIEMPAIHTVRLSGACDAYFSGIWETDLLDVSMSGASDLEGTFEARRMQLGLSGASEIKLKGKTGQLSVDGSGASEFHLQSLAAEEVSVDLSGACSARVDVSGSLNADLSGASDLQYSGNPSLSRMDTSGGSSIKKVNY